MRVLLIGSSFSAMPMLTALRAAGMHVTTMGKHDGDPCHAHSDDAIHEDYSDQEALLQACMRNDFDFIVPTCNDYSYISASHVAGKMGYPGFDGPDVTDILHVKNHFRAFCNEISVPVPQIYNEISRGQPIGVTEFTGNALVKPVDSFSGRGISLVGSAAEAIEAAENAFRMSRTHAAVIEQFVDGSLHSHTAFIADKKIVWHEFVDEFCEVYPYQVDRSLYPSRLSSEQRKAVNAAMETVVSALQLCDGLLHTQFIASDDEFWIIECMRRCPGDLYGLQFALSFGFHYENAYLCGFLGSSPAVPQAVDARVPVERRVISVEREMPFFAAGIRADRREVIFVPLKESGQSLGPAPFDKAGILFLTGESDGEDAGCAPSVTFLPNYSEL